MKKILVSLAEALGKLNADGSITPHPFVNPAVTVPAIEWDGTEEGVDAQLMKLVPPKKGEYQMPREVARDLNAWHHACSGEPLLIFGNTGTGKTAAILDWYGSRGIPLYRCNLHRGTELHDLFGFQGIVEGDTEFKYGPIALAAMHGMPVLLDEFDRARPDVLVGLNGVMDVCLGQSSAFSLPGSDEMIVPKEGFTIIATANTNLCGDESGTFNTAEIQDGSVKKRFAMAIEMGYPEDQEKQILLDTLAATGKDTAFFEYLFDQEGLSVSTKVGTKKGNLVSVEEFVDGVLQLRDMVRSQSIGNSNAASALETTFCVRTLTRFMRFFVAFSAAPNQGISALHYSLSRVLTNTCTPTTKIAIHAMVKTVFGVDEKL